MHVLLCGSVWSAMECVDIGSSIPKMYSGGQNCFNVARTCIVLLITHDGKMIKS